MGDEKNYPIDGLLAEIASAAARDDRGFLAELRSGLNENVQEKAWPIIARQRFRFTDAVERKIWLTVGGLAALLAPAKLNVTGWASLGAVMRRIKEGDSNKSDSGLQSYEAKFRRVLNCPDSDELCDVVIGIVRTAERKSVGVDCRQLFWDLRNWNDEARREEIRLRWTRDFYGAFERQEGPHDEQTKEGT